MSDDSIHDALAGLRAERARLDVAIRALEGLAPITSFGTTGRAVGVTRTIRQMFATADDHTLSASEVTDGIQPIYANVPRSLVSQRTQALLKQLERRGEIERVSRALWRSRNGNGAHAGVDV